MRQKLITCSTRRNFAKYETKLKSRIKRVELAENETNDIHVYNVSKSRGNETKLKSRIKRVELAENETKC